MNTEKDGPAAVADQWVINRCDQNCDYLEDPQTIEELRAALEHERNHSVNGGCSHGC